MSVDYLTKDAIIPPNQKFCVMSLWMDDDKKSIKYLKVSGAFLTVEEAQEQVQILKQPGHYNFVAEVGSWNAFDPVPNKGDLNDQLNKMMENYLVGMQKKNYDFEQRKYSMIINNVNDNIKIKQDELKEHEDKNDEKMVKKINEQLKSLMEKLKEYKEKLEVVENKLNNVIIDSKYEASIVSDDFNQNIPVKFTGTVKRTDEKVHNQEWYCVSFLTENGKSLVGIKISGCFETESAANDHSSALRDINESFNVLVGKLYEWSPFNPDPDSVEAGESEYADPQLNETMKKKKENEHKAKLYHEYRKNETIKKNIEDLINNKKKEHETSKKLLEKSTDESAEKKVSTLDEQIKKLEDKMKEYEEKEKELALKIDPKLLAQKYGNKNETENKTLDV